MTMHTKDFLAQELRKAGLEEMAVKAEAGYYHDFLSPLAFPEMQLLEDLRLANTPAAIELGKRHLNGEFDANEAESDAWMNSEEGKASMRMLADACALDLPLN